MVIYVSYYMYRSTCIQHDGEMNMFKEVGQSVPNKRHELKQLLKERIESGFYRPGERLPSGHELAVELNSSYVTVVKALKLLAEEGYVNCRQGVGNFVSRQSAADTGNRRLVNLICPDPVNSQYREEMAHFVVVGSEVFQDAGWEVRPCPIEGDFSNARQAISDPEAYSVITGFRPYWKNFAVSIEHVRNRVVLIGERSEHDGIACITAEFTKQRSMSFESLICSASSFHSVSYCTAIGESSASEIVKLRMACSFQTNSQNIHHSKS